MYTLLLFYSDIKQSTSILSPAIWTSAS